MKQRLHIDLGNRSYDIHTESKCLTGIGEAMRQLFPTAERCMVISNEIVAPLYLSSVEQSLRQATWQVFTHILPDGERYKTIETWSGIMDALMDSKLSRNEPVLALGGGVVGDMVGFAASCYRRGVPFVQIPTTLLAQVDSSVGGKTAVSHPHGKNMIGAFYQPKLVWIDPEVLQTLDKRQLRAGLAEVIKYGAIWDAKFFEYICDQADALQSLEAESISQVIFESCRFKAEIVMQDETEQGARALLNLGHTFGHAIESLTHYRQYLHGEAVAIGMLMAARLSEQLGYAASGIENEVKKSIEALGLPTEPPCFTAEQWLDAMGHDKKNIGSRIRYILLKKIGDAFIAEDVKDSDIRSLISSYA
ncbi:MAG: 3-dehydroquinate synthase [Zetaproteobacteria bacterium CG_4_9_14_3_um_filter_49_83]|nr:MAG: 3-dehydroquinate synthase [Zetaproteobacteria bacterium CG1_02_49_23]PIQ30198.1 MAG: 3-dehydroquinate synthase [Zetaproteobacteria bacterium CG17_big_fil_post_rev_8_21_14_2_50_50_13]PIV30981.1 MAG: 3-dehydroquinate synthase [Zetaproteobacteria bacterium CG02_land_8_20_14_3_00_50_9]PIY55141.1 MAG: 3-dehydroquinate synthase [Zetaproteobacteria bacterium CG_4_10_14_0_8_um_filter_49_80]PJA35091.1 MAG: 3-dehydroquinate synthase [Zetaproteobacteria bacterium CG_4_9_14_3_um_filter_49_83]